MSLNPIKLVREISEDFINRGLLKGSTNPVDVEKSSMQSRRIIRNISILVEEAVFVVLLGLAGSHIVSINNAEDRIVQLRSQVQDVERSLNARNRELSEVTNFKVEVNNWSTYFKKWLNNQNNSQLTGEFNGLLTFWEKNGTLGTQSSPGNFGVVSKRHTSMLAGGTNCFDWAEDAEVPCFEAGGNAVYLPENPDSGNEIFFWLALLDAFENGKEHHGQNTNLSLMRLFIVFGKTFPRGFLSDWPNLNTEIFVEQKGADVVVHRSPSKERIIKVSAEFMRSKYPGLAEKDYKRMTYIILRLLADGFKRENSDSSKGKEQELREIVNRPNLITEHWPKN